MYYLNGGSMNTFNKAVIAGLAIVLAGSTVNAAFPTMEQLRSFSSKMLTGMKSKYDGIKASLAPWREKAANKAVEMVKAHPYITKGVVAAAAVTVTGYGIKKYVDYKKAQRVKAEQEANDVALAQELQAQEELRKQTETLRQEELLRQAMIRQADLRRAQEAREAELANELANFERMKARGFVNLR